MEVEMPQKRVRCRFCDWERPQFFKANGATVSGMNALLYHIDSVHPEEAENIRRHSGRSEDEALGEEVT
jgi:hypothetical protein